MKGYIKLGFKGFCMGMADIIPGISGGTIAFLLGIYEELISSIKSIDLKFLQLLCRLQFKKAFSHIAWPFLLSVFLGIVAAIFTLSKVISWLLHNEPILIHAFFFGLILATVPVIGRIIKKWTISEVVSTSLAACATYMIVGMVPLETPQTLWFLFLSGAISISAMILPGISGAFILVLLGKYQTLLHAVNERDFFIIGIFFAGVVTGIVSFVRLLSWLFKKYHDLTITILTGIVIGSLRKVWPWKETIRTITTDHGKTIPIEEVNIFPGAFNGEVAAACMVMIFGFILALLLNASPEGRPLLSRSGKKE